MIYNETAQLWERPALIGRVLAWLDEHGFDDAFPEARAAMAQAAEIRATVARGIDLDAEHRRLIDDVLSGDTSIELAAVALDDAAAQNALRPEVLSMAHGAALAAEGKAWQILGHDELVINYLRPVVEQAATTIQKALPLPVGVVDDSTAIRVGGAFVTKTWLPVVIAVEEITSTHELYDLLLASRMVGGLKWGDDLEAVEVRFRQPWKLPNHGAPVWGQSPRAPHPLLVALDQIDAEPTCLLPAEAQANRAEQSA